jgi:hypothetical protein
VTSPAEQPSASARDDDQLTWDSVFDSPCLLTLGPWRIDECVECELCAGCATHECYSEDSNAVLHMDWFRNFASPSETECDHIGGPANLVPSTYQPRKCDLAAGHDGNHRARTGWSWPQTHPSKGVRVT